MGRIGLHFPRHPPQYFEKPGYGFVNQSLRGPAHPANALRISWISVTPVAVTTTTEAVRK
jgi:hypothetical protein